ncbi:MAG: aldehyde dehydrogenase family protein [Flavobacteriales bacterium]
MPNFIETYHCRTGIVNEKSFSTSSLDELELALQRSTDAYESGALLDIHVRTLFLNELHEQISRRKEDLFFIYESESSLSRSRFDIEFDRTLNQLKQYRDAAIALHDHTTTSIIAERTLIKRALPLGPVAIFGASNFPLAYSTLGGDVMGAFASGCPVLVKGHPFHAGTSLLSAEIIHQTLLELNLHPGIFGHLLDDGYGIGRALVEDERIKGCGFTGSYEGGMTLFRAAQNRKNPIPFFAEMGSLNPVIILPDAEHLSLHSSALIDSITADAGQFCTKPGIIFCPSNLINEALIHLNNGFYAALSHPMLHPTILTRYLKRIKEIQSLNIGREYLVQHQAFNVPRGFFHLQYNELNDYETLRQEVFGPSCLLVEYQNEEQLVFTLNKLQGQLTTTLIGKNPENSALFSLACSLSGRVILNGVPTGVSVVPAMHHGGPIPASSDARFSAVGEASILRFIRYATVQKSHGN